jgi:homocysteine S-methyltransferase
MRCTLEQTLQKCRVMVLDGAMSTALEELGAQLNSKLWTASVLAEHPELVEKVHTDYFEAGADCGITCSYQASIPGYTAAGYTPEEARQLIALSVKIFQRARSRWWNAEGAAAGRAMPLCLGSCGPYGAFLADGSEYRGHYGVSNETLREFHRSRAEILWNAGADLLLFETQPSLNETLVEAEIAEDLGADFWVSFSCSDETHTCEGQDIAECARALAEFPHLRMIGVNCTAPRYVESLIRRIKSVSDLPVAVYPNSGREYDPVTKTWSGRGDPRSFGEYALRWFRAGASAVGGCCTTTTEHIRACAEVRKKFLKDKASSEGR